jgi:hypothetical protein
VIRFIESLFDFKAFQEDLRKIGVNFITTGIVGMFINHYAGLNFSTMFWASFWVAFLGLISLSCGLAKKRGNH